MAKKRKYVRRLKPAPLPFDPEAKLPKASGPQTNPKLIELALQQQASIAGLVRVVSKLLDLPQPE